MLSLPDDDAAAADGSAGGCGSLGERAGADDAAWAKVHAKDRELGLAFCQSRPLGRLVIMRLALEPHPPPARRTISRRGGGLQ